MASRYQRAREARERAAADAEIERLGAAILASDRSPQAIAKIMQGRHREFARMDRRDGWPPVPEWHQYLRAARNWPGFFHAIR